MELLKKWQKKYSELNAEYLDTKGMMTEREIYEVKSHLKSISSFIEDIQALRQPLVIGEGLCKYYVRFRNVPPEMMFTPSHLISIDHIQVEAKQDATEWDIKIAICRKLENLNYRPDDIRIESSQPFA